MGRTIITTCGTSLQTSSAWQDPQCRNGQPLAQINDPEECHLISGIYETFTRRFSEPAALAAQFDRQCWDDIGRLGKLPAELASLRALVHYYEQGAQPPQPLGTGDQVIFLSSDNERGRFCAQCLEAILRTNNLLPGVNCQFEEIRGLDPACPADFQTALQKMWAFCHDLANNLPNGSRLILNLTGGYKAMGLVLAALSTLVQLTPPPTIIYLHETARAEQLLIYSYDKNKSVSDWLAAGFHEPTGRSFAIAGAL
ncbi:MAG: hypothetical protein ACUVRZ_10020 [Desulfobacca sp.]|uniref:hypothetical protein n=1 Tax=Desulfobacca sp. TaxID=2067990 RepID=UPI00404A9DC3